MAEVPEEAAAAIKKSPWTKEEDAVLRDQVRQHGAQNWAAISEALPGRNPKSCRLRWCQHLDPVVDTTKPFSPQEDDTIIAYYRQYPNKWATIAAFLRGRTDNAIKNRWHSVLRKVYQKQQEMERAAAAAAPVFRRLSDDATAALALFPLAPGDVRAFPGHIPVLPRRHRGDDGVDLSRKCLNLFPLVPGDLVRVDSSNNAGGPAAMDLDCKKDHELLVELRLGPLISADPMAAFKRMVEAALKKKPHLGSLFQL